MSETFSQADLDALLGGPAAPSSETPAETSDMDKLFNDLVTIQGQAPARAEETGCAGTPSDSENLSQDQIDELLKQFLG